MLAIREVTKLAHQINLDYPYLSEIHSQKEHTKALELMEGFLEDYDNNLFLIEALSNAIARYEEDAPEFQEFNSRLNASDNAIATLKVLMDQYNLNTTNFANEIGKKSMVSQVLNGNRELTRKHIAKLAERFSVSPALFF